MIRKLKNLKHFLSSLAAVIYYRYPARSLFVIGVTGTDGKTTTVNLIYHLLKSAGQKVAMISTLGALVDDKEAKIGFHVTTPNSWKIQQLLKMAVTEGVKYVVLEATSHGLDQHRLLGCNFRVGVITNASREHLDYHKNFENYLAAKAILFKGVRYAVLNQDDASYKYLSSLIKEEATSVLSYGINTKAYVTPKNFVFKTKLLGQYNIYNCLAAIAVARIFEIPDEVIRRSLLTFPTLKGRLEEIKGGQRFKVFVDFAHTPGAFKQVIPAIRKITKGEVIHVFGATGDRDIGKRPIMGRVAGELDDKIILTHEDTYREDPEKILSEIEPGIIKSGKILGKNYWKISNRSEAIKRAIKLAKKNDTVLITGVGHQTSLNIGGKEIPWSDQQQVIKAIRERNRA